MLYLLESMYHFKFFIDLLGKLHFFADIMVNVYISKASLCENEAFCQVTFWWNLVSEERENPVNYMISYTINYSINLWNVTLLSLWSVMSNFMYLNCYLSGSFVDIYQIFV